ncbi:hypothetical protein DYB37_002095 [Aphanomyces astaci]|uniref:ATP phosphoribosyltransferase n=1 Tax=Aphanomyces astaci TaxID=112090 RepID=A0A3R7B0I7_APHAT|nr:hypothetical protein DYB35_001449 [Aphanomyces astaci]RHZ23779.1 hypothetical protein DYB37_002095 [Aphanomyces astaci]
MADIPSTENNLLFAVPKKGRLHDHIVKFLNGAGLDYTRNLGFGKCSLSVQAPVASGITDPSVLAGKRIVTSFPNVAREYFKQFEVPGKPTRTSSIASWSLHIYHARIDIKYVGGSVEAACGLGLADGIVDLVETGTTMKAAGLEIVSNIMKTEAVLISNPNTKHGKLVTKIHQRLLGFLFAQKYRMISYNIARDKLQKAITITPGRKAPTINPLLNEDYCAVSAMVPRHDVADIMDDLHELGATDIFVLDIENCRA